MGTRAGMLTEGVGDLVGDGDAGLVAVGVDHGAGALLVTHHPKVHRQPCHPSFALCWPREKWETLECGVSGELSRVEQNMVHACRFELPPVPLTFLLRVTEKP